MGFHYIPFIISPFIVISVQFLLETTNSDNRYGSGLECPIYCIIRVRVFAVLALFAIFSVRLVVMFGGRNSIEPCTNEYSHGDVITFPDINLQSVKSNYWMQTGGMDVYRGIGAS